MTELVNRYKEGTTLAGIIYVHRISDNRFGGIAGRNFGMFRKLCGESTLKNVVLVTNMWGESSQDVNEAREKELSDKFFKPTLDKGARMVRHDNTVQSAHDVIRGIIKNHPVTLQVQRELVDERKDIIDTAAGESINQELKELVRRHQAELKELRGEMMRALHEKDEELKRELQEAKWGPQEMVKIREVLEGIAVSYTTEKTRMEARVTEMGQEARRDRQRAEARFADLDRRLKDVTNASAADRARLEQEAREERQRVEAEHKQQLADLERRLRDTIDVADRAKQEQRQAELKEKDEAVRQTLEERTRELRGQMDEIKKDSEGLEVRMKEMEQGAKKERERAEAELANLKHHLRDAINASAADRARLEQEARERRRDEADHKQQLADLNHRLQDAIHASAADRARFEREARERERAEAEHKQLADLTCRLQGEATASTAHRTRLEQEVKGSQDRVVTVTTPPHLPPRPTLYVQCLFCPAAAYYG